MGGRGMGKHKPRHGPKKCGISLALDGSENHLLHIEKLPEYAMPEEVAEIQEYELLSDDEDEGEGNENDEFDIMEEYELLSDDEDEGEGNENDEFDIMEEYELLSDDEDEGEGNENDEFDIMEELQ